MVRAALLLGAAALALLVSGASASASPSACADGGAPPAWSPTGLWIAWQANAAYGICFAHPNGTDRRFLRLSSAEEGAYQLVWARPNLLVADGDYLVFSVAFRPKPHVLPPGHAFSGLTADSTFSLDAKADLLASANSHGAGPVTIMRAGGGTTSFGDSSVVNRDPSLAPDGKHVVWAAPGGILQASIDGTNLETLTAQGARPLWSPSGRKIAFEYAGLQVMSASGGQPTTVAPDCCMYGDPQTIVWSPNSRLLAYVNNADRLSIVDLRTKRERTVKRVGLVDQLAWAPKSHDLLVSAGTTRVCPSLWRVPARHGKPKLVSRCGS